MTQKPGTQRPDDTDTNVSLSGKGLKGRMLAATALGVLLTAGIGGNGKGLLRRALSL